MDETLGAFLLFTVAPPTRAAALLGRVSKPALAQDKADVERELRLPRAGSGSLLEWRPSCRAVGGRVTDK